MVGFLGRVAGMLIPVGGFRTNAVAWGLTGFGVVCLLSANRLDDWRALTFLGLALVVPSVVWLWTSGSRGRAGRCGGCSWRPPSHSGCGELRCSPRSDGDNAIRWRA